MSEENKKERGKSKKSIYEVFLKIISGLFEVSVITLFLYGGLVFFDEVLKEHYNNLPIFITTIFIIIAFGYLGDCIAIKIIRLFRKGSGELILEKKRMLLPIRNNDGNDFFLWRKEIEPIFSYIYREDDNIEMDYIPIEKSVVCEHERKDAFIEIYIRANTGTWYSLAKENRYKIFIPKGTLVNFGFDSK